VEELSKPPRIKDKISIAISAGEASGDLLGACLVNELKSLLPDAQFWGAGGKRMREAGVETAVDTEIGSAIGVLQVLKALPRFLVQFHLLKNKILKEKPNVFIPIDFGAFNVRIGKLAAKEGIKVVYYFPPSSWRRTLRNSSALKEIGGKVITPFPWSRDNLCAQGIDARFVGHPLVDIAKPDIEKDEFLNKLCISDSKFVVGLLPGSRTHEVSEHLEPMFNAAKIINNKFPGTSFLVASAGKSDNIKKALDKYCPQISGNSSVTILENQTYNIMASSDFLICTSGTATLEAAIIGTPMVIIYRGTAIMRFEFLFRKAVIEKFIGLPNIILDKLVCPEILANDVTAQNLANITIDYLSDKQKLANAKDELSQVKGILGEEGASKRAAKELIEMAGLL
jgi:lipid-A-disaccharide synthase